MKTTDIDIDVPDRKIVDTLKLNHYKASMIHKDVIKAHNCGIYFQEIPTLYDTNIATIPYDKADSLGYFKFDILSNSVYTHIESEEDMELLLNTEPDWQLMSIRENVEKLTQIHGQYDVVTKWLPSNVLELAMLLALIRPSKRYLMERDTWEDIKDEIWLKPDNDSAYFKKPHAIAYAHSIKIQLNLIKAGRL